MIPCAGDEITECIAKTYLVDFNTAEKIKMSASTKKKGLVTFKDIMGITQKVDALEIRNAAADVVNAMAKDVAEKIIELNGGKPVNAVFVVGGGGKIPGYTERVADCLGIPHQRVAVRGEEVLTAVDFQVDNFKKDSLYVTPVGICTNYYTQKNNFVFVTVNKERNSCAESCSYYHRGFIRSSQPEASFQPHTNTISDLVLTAGIILTELTSLRAHLLSHLFSFVFQRTHSVP